MVIFRSNVIPALLLLQEDLQRLENKKVFIVIAKLRVRIIN